MPRPSKIYPDKDFWFEKIPSGNPGGCDIICALKAFSEMPVMH
jgi:hypothetical protein